MEMKLSVRESLNTFTKEVFLIAKDESGKSLNVTIEDGYMVLHTREDMSEWKPLFTYNCCDEDVLEPLINAFLELAEKKGMKIKDKDGIARMEQIVIESEKKVESMKAGFTALINNI